MLHPAHLLIRLGLAFVFGYAAVGSFFTPDAWIGYYPTFLRDMIPHAVLLNGFALAEIGVALWLITGRASRMAGVVSAALLAGIVVFNFGLMDILFRDVGLICAALALAVWDRRFRL